MFTSYANLLSLLGTPDADPTSLLNAAMEFSAESAEVPELAFAVAPDAGEKLIEALETSGAHGMSNAFIELGTLYRAGGTWRSRLIERHIDNALDAFRRADTLGHRDGSIMVVETIYHSGRTDLASEAWARLRSITHQDPSQTGALFMQGLLTQEGFGVSRNLEAAMRYFRRGCRSQRCGCRIPAGAVLPDWGVRRGTQRRSWNPMVRACRRARQCSRDAQLISERSTGWGTAACPGIRSSRSTGTSRQHHRLPFHTARHPSPLASCCSVATLATPSRLRRTRTSGRLFAY